jgi:CDP-diacylglycerol--glycerol-3-phosphate 3-phosphatidyltransferase
LAANACETGENAGQVARGLRAGHPVRLPVVAPNDGSMMNFPNKITMCRIGLTFVMVGFLTATIPFGKTLALVTFGLGGLSDWLDGMLARRTGQVSVFGQLMDPLADKILVSAAFISFVAIHQIVPAWIVTTIVSREFLITGLRLLGGQKGRVLAAGNWGKHKMIWQTVTIVVIMLGLALQEDLLPLFMQGEERALFMDVFDIYFTKTAMFLSLGVGALTVVSGAIYLWESRDLYVEHA